MATKTKPRAALYGRLSMDRDGDSVTVERQLRDCRALATRKGWTVVEEFRDDSASAWKRDRKRPGWDALLASIKSGAVDAVVVYHGDRLVRQPFDLEALLSLVEERGLLVASPSGTRDLGNSDDRFILRIETAAACRESDSTSRRVRRKRQDEAESGRRHGAVPYGWRSPDEADVVRWLTKELLNGSSLKSVTRSLNDRGVPAPRGGTWAPQQVRQLAQRASNAGLRSYRGEVAAAGDWEALVSREDWEAVSSLLSDPTRRWAPSSARKHLLSALARCGVCGGPMRGGMSGKRHVYRCVDNYCTSIHKQDTDDYVLAVIGQRLARPDARRAFAPSDEAVRTAQRRARDLRRRLDDAADDYAAGLIDRRQMARITEQLRPQVEQAERDVAAFGTSGAVAAIVGRDAVKRLAALPLDRQRAVIDTLAEIRILPTTSWAVGFKPERVQIDWRTA